MRATSGHGTPSSGSAASSTAWSARTRPPRMVDRATSRSTRCSPASGRTPATAWTPGSPGETALLLEPALGRSPVDVGEVRLDVLCPLERLVVRHEGVLPRVHHDDRPEPGDVVDLVQGDPVVGQPARV